MRLDQDGTLYLRMFSRAAAKASADWHALPVLFALTTSAGRLERSGETSFLSLGALINRSRKIILIMAASDVTLLHLAVPPLSSVRLKVALPALVEDRLIADPLDCVLAAGPDVGGMRIIAVIARDWLHEVRDLLNKSGAHRIHAYPAQACLPLPLNSSGAPVSAAITQTGKHIDLALRLSVDAGLGLSLLVPGEEMEHEELQFETDLCRNMQALAAHHAVVCMVSSSQQARYRQAARQLSAEEGAIMLIEDDWQKWISGAQQAVPDLMTGIETVRTQRLSWQNWRWPLLLAGLLLLLNVIALYLDWWQLKNTGQAIRARMTHLIQAAYPDEQVTGEPLAYLQQKIRAHRQLSGELSPDDFLMQAALLADSLSLSPTSTEKQKTQNPAIAALEYKDAVLQVRFKPNRNANSNLYSESVRKIFSSHNMQLTIMPEQDGAVVWQIRSAR